MDRKAFVVYAGVLASFGAILGVSCDTQSVNSPVIAQTTPQPGAGGLPPGGPGPRRLVWDAPLVPAVAFAGEAELRADSLVVPVVALAEEGGTSSTGKANMPPPTVADALPKTQIKFADGAVTQKSSRWRPLPLIVADSWGENEFKFATSDTGPEVTSPPAQKRLVLTYEIPEDRHDSTDDKASQHISSNQGPAPSNVRKNDVRMHGATRRVIPNRETPKQDVARSTDPPNRDVSSHDRPATADKAPVADSRGESEFKFVVKSTKPKLPSPAERKTLGPAFSVPADDDVAIDNKISDRNSSDPTPADRDVQKDKSHKPDIATGAVPKRGTLNQDVPKRNPPNREVAGREQPVESGTPSVAAGGVGSEIKSATRGARPESANALAKKNSVPAYDIPADASTDHKVSDHDSADQAAADRRPQTDDVHQHDLLTRDVPKRESPKQSISKLRPSDRDFPDHDQSATPDSRPIADDSVKPADPGPLRTKLPWAEHAQNSPEMITAADQRVRQGFRLAEQGALYLARAEFIAALKLIAQANDARQGTRWHSRAVTAGFLALKESTDFINQNAGIEDADIAKIVSGHKTSILMHVDVSEMTPMVAAQHYYTYAQEQLAGAAAQEMSGSMALYGLGKATIAAAGNKLPDLEYTGQARALYRAALMAEGKNYLAANELGVLLMENGQPELARELLIRSINLSRQAVTLQNLAAVHARLGERELAETAREQALALRRSGSAVGGPVVQWVDPATFARMTLSTGDLAPPAAPAKMEPAPANATPDSAKPPENVAKKDATNWFPWKLRR